jgi:hypothetical protein
MPTAPVAAAEAVPSAKAAEMATAAEGLVMPFTKVMVLPGMVDVEIGCIASCIDRPSVGIRSIAPSAGGGCFSRGHRLHGLAVAGGLTDIHGNDLARQQIAIDLHLVTVIVPQSYLDQLEAVVAHCRQIDVVITEDQGVIGNRNGGGRDLRGHLHIGVHSRIKRPILIWQIDLDQHCASGLIESFRMSGYFA